MYVPVANGPFAGNATAAASDNVTVTLLGTNPAPTSEKANRVCPPGPARSTSTSLPQLWVRFLSVMVTLVTVPFIPVTLIVDGYGEPAPWSGIVIAPELVKVVVTVTDGITLTTKLVLVLLGPSFTVTVIVALPVCPAVGVRINVRLAPPPPNPIFPVGINAGLDDDALN